MQIIQVTEIPTWELRPVKTKKGYVGKPSWQDYIKEDRLTASIKNRARPKSMRYLTAEDMILDTHKYCLKINGDHHFMEINWGEEGYAIEFEECKYCHLSFDTIQEIEHA